jgi:CheY-like chemotaxis protein
MPTIRLIHWNDAEGRARRNALAALGYDVQFDAVDGAVTLQVLRASPPDAVVIDCTRLPSHGREVGRVLRMTKGTRHVPLVFVGGDPEKVAQTRALLPDATYTSWSRVKAALPRAMARPPATPVVPKDVMSAKPAVAKLGVKPGFRVCLLGAPKGFAATLTPLPKGVTFTAKADASCSLFIGFLRSARELHAQIMVLGHVIDRQVLWLLWPKKASGVKSDLDGNLVRRTGLASGWVDFKVCSVDEIWSGLAFKKRR